ncbi:MAG: TonB-dependent receptor plug domain-containing protein, partial [bacterium]|nr:TonB-dependent receptor plug domain-containing protein [bacterium]
RNEYSVAEAIRLVPGVRVQQAGGPGSLTTVQARGLETHHTAFLVDGLRMRDPADPQGAVTPFWENLMAVSTERAEVLRGSGSSLYGSHAIGGTINVVSHEGGGSPRGEVSAEGGGLGMARGLARFSGGTLHNRLLYAGGVTHANVTGGLDGANPWRNTTGHGFAKYLLKPTMSLSVRVIGADSFTRLADSASVRPEVEGSHPAGGIIRGIPLPDSQVRLVERGLPFSAGNATFIPSLNDPDDRRTGSFVNLATIFSHQLTGALSYRASYQFLDSKRRFQTGPGGQLFEPAGFSTDSTFDGAIHVGELRANLQAGRYNLLSGGYEFEEESYDNLNTDENPDPVARALNRARIRQRSHSVFVQDQISLLDRNLQIAVSGRLQTFRVDEPEFRGGASPYEGIGFTSPKRALTGDAAISYLFRSTGTKWRAHAGNSYRAPSTFERFGSSFFFGSFSPFGDPRLRPERALSFDTGVDQYLAGSRVKLGATYFYTNLQEIILFDFSGLIPPDDPFGRFGGYVNVPGGMARGVELSVNTQLTQSTAINASYTYTNSRQRTPWDASGQVTKLPNLSDNMFTLLVSQWIGRRVNLTFDLFAAGSYLTPIFTSGGSRPFEISGPVKADVVARYVHPLSDTRSLEFHVKLENIADNNLYEKGFRTPGLWAVGGLRLVF